MTTEATTPAAEPGAGEACRLPTLRLPNATELPPELQAMVDKGGDELWFRQLGHAPQALKSWLDFYYPLVFKGQVELRTKEVARLRIAALNDCHY